MCTDHLRDPCYLLPARPRLFWKSKRETATSIHKYCFERLYNNADIGQEMRYELFIYLEETKLGLGGFTIPIDDEGRGASRNRKTLKFYFVSCVSPPLPCALASEFFNRVNGRTWHLDPCHQKFRRPVAERGSPGIDRLRSAAGSWTIFVLPWLQRRNQLLGKEAFLAWVR